MRCTLKEKAVGSYGHSVHRGSGKEWSSTCRKRRRSKKQKEEEEEQ